VLRLLTQQRLGRLQQQQQQQQQQQWYLYNCAGTVNSDTKDCSQQNNLVHGLAIYMCLHVVQKLSVFHQYHVIRAHPRALYLHCGHIAYLHHAPVHPASIQGHAGSTDVCDHIRHVLGPTDCCSADQNKPNRTRCIASFLQTWVVMPCAQRERVVQGQPSSNSTKQTMFQTSFQLAGLMQTSLHETVKPHGWCTFSPPSPCMRLANFSHALAQMMTLDLWSSPLPQSPCSRV
jgi:hypothetical protein